MAPLVFFGRAATHPTKDSHPMETSREVLRAVMSAVKDGRPLALTLTVSGSRIRVVVRPPPISRRRKPTQCERAILLVLTEADPMRMTTTRIFAALARREIDHGDSTVRRALARMSKAGTVIASRKSPRGYRLAPTREGGVS
jgi:hypothetical protein